MPCRKLFIAAFLLLTHFSFPEVFWEQFSFRPGSFSGEKKLHAFEKLPVRNVTLHAEVVKLPKSGMGVLPPADTRGRLLFRDAVSAGYEKDGQIVLLKLVGPDAVFRVTLTRREFEAIFER
jgi:hypothetical protein